jgi:hypothetical protein
VSPEKGQPSETRAGGHDSVRPLSTVQLWCYTRPMSTVHPRIALTRDPELDEALRRARPLLGEGKPTATLARELILRGARELLSNQGTALDQWLDQRDACPAARSTEEVLATAAKLGAPDASGPYATSQALERQRDERL